MADPEEIYAEVLAEEQGKGVSAAVAEGRAKAARVRAEHGSPHPKESKWWPGAQPHLEGGDGAAPAEAAEEAPAEEPAAEEPAAAAEAPATAATEEAAAEQQPAEAPTAPEAPAATEEQQAPQVPQEQAPPPAEPVQPAAAAAPQAAQARPSGVTHGTATGTRVRPEDSVTTEAQYQGQQAVYDRRKLIDELIATGVPAAAASEAGERRSPMLFLLYLLIPLIAIGIVLSLDEGGAPAAGPDEGHGGGGGLTISASNVQFDTNELTFPADEATTLTFNNEDSVEHNFSIYENEDAEADIFIGQNIGAGASTDYEIPATPAGEYFFRCDLHPSAMVGTAIFE